MFPHFLVLCFQRFNRIIFIQLSHCGRLNPEITQFCVKQGILKVAKFGSFTLLTQQWQLQQTFATLLTKILIRKSFVGILLDPDPQKNVCKNLWMNVFVLHKNEGGIEKSIPDAREISRDPRYFPRAKPEGNLEGRWKSLGRRGWISQYLPSFGGVRTSDILLIINPSTGIDQDREGLTVLKSIFQFLFPASHKLLFITVHQSTIRWQEHNTLASYKLQHNTVQ